MRCDRLAEVLAGYDDGPPGRLARRHVEQCLRCQADVARYRRLRRVLGGLRAEALVPPHELFAALAAELDDLDQRPVHGAPERRRAVVLAGLAALTVAGVGGVLVLAARGRRAAR